MLLAANAPIAGLTTVNGLAHARPGAENVLRLLQRVGCRDIPVAVGAAAPLSGDRAFVSSWRDKADALAEITLPPTDLEPVSSSAAEFLVHTVNERPSQVALLCLGPLTNVALALQLAGERFVQQVGKIVMMGGAVRVPGNDTPNDVSEWNLYVDPLAAAQTVHSGIPITMIGLDVTNAAPCTPQLVQAMCERRPQSPAARVMQETMQGMYDYLYDQVAAAYLLDPAIVQTARLPIQVVDTGPHVGQTVETSSGTPIDVALTLDQRRFHQLLLRLVGEA
jgi:purine nucleosidase